MKISLMELKEVIRGIVARAVRFSSVANTSELGDKNDSVDGRSEAGEPAAQVSVRRLWPFGLRSRPPAGVDAVVVHANGGSSNGVMVGAESSKYGPTDLEVGEACVYSSANPEVLRARETGKTELSSAQSQDVVVNGGTLKVARATDQVEALAALATWAGQVELAITNLGGVPPSPTFSTFANAIARIASGAGASHFKA